MDMAQTRSVVRTALHLNEHFSCRMKKSCPQLSIQPLLSFDHKRWDDCQTPILHR